MATNDDHRIADNVIVRYQTTLFSILMNVAVDTMVLLSQTLDVITEPITDWSIWALFIHRNKSL